jgi:hypothetical protein
LSSRRRIAFVLKALTHLARAPPTVLSYPICANFSVNITQFGHTGKAVENHLQRR